MCIKMRRQGAATVSWNFKIAIQVSFGVRHSCPRIRGRTLHGPTESNFKTEHYRIGISTDGALYPFLTLSAHAGFMVEKRAFPRHRLLKVGTIEFDGDVINCMVGNLSTAGAALDVANPIGIPEYFMLIADGSHLPCHVIWRKEKRIGVTFE
jgi:PilZ domain